MHELSRRRLLQVGTTGTVAAVAGCGQLAPGETENSQDDGDVVADSQDDATGTDSATVTVVAAPDEEELNSLRQELQTVQQEVAAGEISQEQAVSRQEEISADAQQLIAEAVAGVETHAGETSGLSLLDTVEQEGVLLVEGTPANLIGLLGRADVDGLFGEDRFDELQQQGQQP